ncbi:UDP-2,4-diacetamido-2,4,6-trideoxy-beta-L-altropyranose hydrolase [Bradyrhizobium sp. GM24.11]
MSATGAGHLGRCLALAEAYSASGWRVEFILTGDAFAHLPGSDHAWRVAKPDQTLEVVGKIAPDGCDVLVIDDYERGEVFEAELRGIARCIVVLDDQTGRRHHCDLLIDAAVRDADAYRNLVGDPARFLVGPKYALVRSDILALRRRAMEPRRDREVANILLTFGATDPAGLTLRLMEAVGKAFPEHITITIALSSRARDIEAIRSRIAVSGRIRLLIDADMGEVIAASDVAVGAGGVGAFERAALGLPGVVVAAVENQRGVARLLVDAKASLDGGGPDQDLVPRVVRQLAMLVNDVALRRDMAAAAALLVDGRAANRIHFACAAPAKVSVDTEVRLRAAEPADADWLLVLQHEPATRRFARNPAPPSREQHLRWLAAIFEERSSVLAIVETNGLPSGMIRLDRSKFFSDEHRRYEVSIAISTAFHGRGVGSAALQLIRALYPGAILDAFVLPENQASLRMFLRAGYIDAGNGFYRNIPRKPRLPEA